MNRRDLCASATIGRRRPSADDWMIATDPGCDAPEHGEEVQGALLALWTSGPWAGSTLMDCGCQLSLQRRRP